MGAPSLVSPGHLVNIWRSRQRASREGQHELCIPSLLTMSIDRSGVFVPRTEAHANELRRRSRSRQAHARDDLQNHVRFDRTRGSPHLSRPTRSLVCLSLWFRRNVLTCSIAPEECNYTFSIPLGEGLYSHIYRLQLTRFLYVRSVCM